MKEAENKEKGNENEDKLNNKNKQDKEENKKGIKEKEVKEEIFLKNSKKELTENNVKNKQDENDKNEKFNDDKNNSDIDHFLNINKEINKNNQDENKNKRKNSKDKEKINKSKVLRGKKDKKKEEDFNRNFNNKKSQKEEEEFDWNYLNTQNFPKNNNNNNNNYKNNSNYNTYNPNFNKNKNYLNKEKNQNNNNQNNSQNTNEDTSMDEKILSEIMQKNPGVKFSDIIGMKNMKQTLYEIIIIPTIRPDLFTGIRKPQRGILLFGPPGTGKTLIAKAIASECKSTFFNISASSLTSKWVGESEKTVKSLFKIAYQKVPSIIFIDEIDSILSKRSESENEATKRLKTEFLIQFDGLGSNTKAKLLVIAATNRPMDLDEALLRRLPKRIYCSPLDEEERFNFIKKVINRVDTNLSDEDIQDIAKKTEDYSNSDLMELCREAAYEPVRELTDEEILKLDKFRPITKNDLDIAIKKIRPSLNKKVKDELFKWNQQFGGV